MLGWPPRHHRQNGASSGSRCPPPSHGVLQFASLDDEKPALQPHRIVIGFELGLADHKGPQQASDSPRSVLEPEQPRPPSPLSPLSALGSLLTGHAACARADITINELTTNVHAANNVTGGNGGACFVDKVEISDLSARSKNNRSRAANDQRNGKRRERRRQHRYSSMLGSDDEYDGVNDEVETVQSIFSAGSPTPHSPFCKESGTYFLSKCYRCRRKLADGKDIYMYRGDQAFCSQDCRYMQIVADERKHRSPAVIPCISGASRGICSVARATQTAFA